MYAVGVILVAALHLQGLLGGESGQRLDDRSLRMAHGRPPDHVMVDTIEWSVDPVPILEIGHHPSDPNHQLFQVMDAARLADGRIALVNRGTGELRLYDAEGRFTAALGGAGEGPGRFRGIVTVQVGPTDSLFVYDEALQRLSVFSSRGDLGRTETVSSLRGRLGTVVRFVDGRWIGRERDQPIGGVQGIHRDTVRFIRFSEEFETEELVFKIPGQMTSTFRYNGRRVYRATPFTPRPVHSQHGNCLYVSAGDSPDIAIFSSIGERLRTLTTIQSREAVSESDVDEWIGAIVEAVAPGTDSQERRALSRIPTPDSFPLYSDLIVDALGNIWLQEYQAPFGVGRAWRVLDPRGNLIGRISMPAPLEVFEIGQDYVLGLWKTGLGEEVVRLYALRRGDSVTVPHEACL